MPRRTKLLLALFALVVAFDVLFLAGLMRGCSGRSGAPSVGARAGGR